MPRPRHFTLDVVTWTRLVFKRPALTSEGEEKLRSKESPPPSPRILSQEPGFGTISAEEHLGREEGVEMKEMKVVLPPPESLESPLPTTDLDIILPPPEKFLEDHPSTDMQTSQEQTASFGPFGLRNEHRAQSLPPMPTSSMDTSSRVEQGITLTLPSVAGKYGYPPPK